MKYLIKPVISSLLYTIGVVYIFFKFPATTIHFLMLLFWDFNFKSAFTEAHTEWFAVFYEDADEIVDYDNWTVTERKWYYRTIHDFVNQVKTYPKN